VNFVFGVEAAATRSRGETQFGILARPCNQSASFRNGGQCAATQKMDPSGWKKGDSEPVVGVSKASHHPRFIPGDCKQ
jgi:hypothetical protein